MPIVLRFESFVESQLQGIGPPELVSIAAELLVAACMFGPIVAVFALSSWLLRRVDRGRLAPLHRRPLR